ncbi:MAG TPA: glycoside hydrolase domain-containing protein, partial [Arachidicoccus sp.]|nr:glycoside hydrolase domain-containing protein [Arachidicoccus sp.]
MIRKLILIYLFTTPILRFGLAQNADNIIWQIGTKDNAAGEFALAPNGFKNYVSNDFGYEDKFFVVGFSKMKTDFPYVLPGPVDTWGGTHAATGWRTNQLNMLFSVNRINSKADYSLVLDLADYAKKFLPLIKITINGQSRELQLTAKGYDIHQQKAPRKNEPFVDSAALLGNNTNRTGKSIVLPISGEMLREGGNQITLTILEGSWIMFDRVALEGDPATKLNIWSKAFIGQVQAADYELQTAAQRVQPLLVETKYLAAKPVIRVALDGKTIFKQSLAKTNCVFECPMPAVQSAITSHYKIWINEELVEQGTIKRSPQRIQTPADYVDTRIGSAHSRWMIAPGPWMPFSMVKMSPDNQNAGRMAGYEPHFETIGTFSHIHEWTMAGLGIFATNGKLETHIGDELNPDSGYRSRIDKKGEEAPIGYYKAQLTDYNIKAEITSTTRCSFERFTFPKNRDSARILLDFKIPAEYNYQLKEVSWKKVSDYRIEGFSHQYSAHVWSRDADQDYTLHFVMEFDQPLKDMGYWLNDRVVYGDKLNVKDIKSTGLFLQFDQQRNPVVQVRMGISLVGINNAAQNLNSEITKPFGWDFNAVRHHQVDVWNEIFNRVKITTPNRDDKVRFYNALYRSICSRNTWSDINGQWRGTDDKINQFKDVDNVALGCDALWNTFWNLNQVWNLITPEWSKRWVNSQLAMYDANGWLAKGPAGMNYIPVMVAEHEIAQMVSAYQMGIRGFDANKVLEAGVKMQTTPAQKLFKGYVGNRDLLTYERHH